MEEIILDQTHNWMLKNALTKLKSFNQPGIYLLRYKAQCDLKNTMYDQKVLRQKLLILGIINF